MDRGNGTTLPVLSGVVVVNTAKCRNPEPKWGVLRVAGVFVAGVVVTAVALYVGVERLVFGR